MDNQTLMIAAVGLLALLGTVLALSAHRRIGLARKSLLLLQGTFEGKTLIDAVASYINEVRDIDQDVKAVSQRQEELFALLGRSKRNLGVTRYDAFEDMGGKLSFSMALLDDHGNGAVITSINGRTESRAYAKVVEGGASEHNLSPEEREAISEALSFKQRVRR